MRGRTCRCDSFQRIGWYEKSQGTNLLDSGHYGVLLLFQLRFFLGGTGCGDASLKSFTAELRPRQRRVVTFDPRGVRPSLLVFWKALLMLMNADYCAVERASVFIDCRRDEHSAKISVSELLPLPTTHCNF